MITAAELEEAYQKEKLKLQAEADTTKQVEQKVTNEIGKVNVELESAVDPVASQVVSSHYTALMVVALIICAGIISAGIHKYFFC